MWIPRFYGAEQIRFDGSLPAMDVCVVEGEAHG